MNYESQLKEFTFSEPDEFCNGDNVLYSLKLPDGDRITVLDRLTGFGWRDIETGYKDKDGKFWLASGNFDIRDYDELSAKDAICKIKENSNTCTG